MRHRTVVIVTALVALALGSLSAVSRANAKAMAPCHDCPVCLIYIDGHRINSGSGTDVQGIPHPCLYGNCSVHSDDCEVAFNGPQLEAITRTILREQGVSLRNAVALLGSQGQVNLERRVLQVLGCEGQFVASVPLTEQQIADIARLAD